MTMPLFPVLSSFYETISVDSRINSTHISLYMALVQEWNQQGGINPIQIMRQSIMKNAKISARYTYHKCIRNLHEYGYINYQPTNNCHSKTVVFLKRL
jgi:hypothetical protein